MVDESIKKLVPVYALVFLRALSLSITITGPIMPLYVRSLGVSVSQWSFMSTSFAIGLISFEAFWGSMSDRVNRIRILIVSMILMSLVLPLYTFPDLMPYFFVFQFLIGSFFVMVGPTSRALIAELSPDDRLGFNMSLWSSCFAIGGISGPVLGGLIAKNFGYPTAFYASTAILLLAALMMFITGKDDESKEGSNRGISVLLNNLRSIMSDSRIKTTFITAFLIFFSTSAVRSFIPIYASELYGMDEVSIGIMLSLGTVLQLLGTPIIGRLSDRINAKRMLTVLLAASGVLLLTYWFAQTPLHLTVITALVILGFISSSVSLILLTKLADREKLGMTMGLYGSFEDLGLVIGPLVFGFVWDSFGPKYLFPVSAVALFLAIISISQVNIEG
ncbi:MFS transporter [Candidatus Bathyarchaeota archaeon]|jgi:MFS transporter, DHA1 family, multidrug resistance protein|nr:MFS transporter [Candidatus Bathyarchaeota archaeon]MBT4319223.1 MFS transporter [Candidatus Bathyarchaeota archaeon]MBT4423022.1 MFS transporter [Candidatus Bathyarchaeota archaeon]MBT5643110.1 MFS transporter [Candidatus Bathyarchaeota archaeon]MBT6605206.1 MFS transporter [Candidatus Bathyarchaeota archaeon]